MREELLHFIWKFRKFPFSNLKTTNGDTIIVHNVGSHNQLSGPDFFNAKLEIGGQVWAGNVEIHIRVSDWYAHNHQDDRNYDSVILHVVWEDDVSVFREDGSIVPSLALKEYIQPDLLLRYQKLFNDKHDKFINCETDIALISKFTINNWLERLYFERLENKSKIILKLLEQSNNDWEKVLFILMLKSFGSKINGDLFFDIGNALDFKIIRNLNHKELELEALLFGGAGLFNSENLMDAYFQDQKKKYDFLVHKYNLDRFIGNGAAFFKLRPLNFPTIRLSQFAQLYATNNNLFQKLMSASVQELYDCLQVNTSEYWESHFTFGKKSKSSKKKTSKKFIDLLIINTILPLRFCYFKHKGKPFNEDVIKTVIQISSEENSILEKYKKIGVAAANARDSQALLQLHNNYCLQNKCLQCAIGTTLLK
jgi:hypothetical protein